MRKLINTETTDVGYRFLDVNESVETWRCRLRKTGYLHGTDKSHTSITREKLHDDLHQFRILSEGKCSNRIATLYLGRQAAEKDCHPVYINQDDETHLHTSFRPCGNGFIERFNRTLQHSLAVYTSQEQTDWDSHLPYILLGYRSAIHSSTGFTPNELMYGWNVKMPIDMIHRQPSPQETDPVSNLPEYVHKQKEYMHHNLTKRLIESKRNKTRTNSFWQF